jgi:hypothetical protein
MPPMLLRTALFAAAGAGFAAAQKPPADGVLLLRNPSGAPVRAAAGVFCWRPDAELVALRDMALALGAPEREQRVAGEPDGELRLRTEDGHAASGVVGTEAGLGALVARLRPGEAQRLVMQPMGLVTTEGESETFTLYARAHLPTGERVTLPRQTEARVRLPEGSYEAWAKNADGWTWQRLDVLSGQRCLLSFAGPAQRVHTRAGTSLHPAGWPLLDLLGGERDATLLASALAAPLVTFVDGSSFGERVLPRTANGKALDWPAADEQPAAAIAIALTGGDDAAAAGAPLVSLQRTAADTWRVTAVARAHDRRFELPANASGDAWLLLVATSCAPFAAPWSPAQPPHTLALAAGRPLAVTARDDKGELLADMALEYVPDRMDAAAVAAHTNGRGAANLGRVFAPGVLRVVDERFANQELALDTIPAGPVEVVATAGLALRGVAKWSDGSPARGVVVTARDPQDAMRPSPRALVTDDKGEFVFTGLLERHALVLFASARRAGHTWSARRDRLRAGGEVELVLADEDPVLGR